jgi:hypothetical protein
MRIDEIGIHRIVVRAGDLFLCSAPYTINLILRLKPGNA